MALSITYKIDEINEAVKEAWRSKMSIYFSMKEIIVGKPGCEECRCIHSKVYNNQDNFYIDALKKHKDIYFPVKKTAKISEERDIANKLIAYYRSHDMNVLEVKHEIISDTYELTVQEKFIGKRYKVSIKETYIFLDEENLKELIEDK